MNNNRLIVIVTALCFVQMISALDVVFRYDDFRLREDSLQDEMIEIFAEEHMPLHIAVIPYNQDTTPILQEGESLERVKELQQQGILQIALHGFCHKGETFQGEFLSLNEAEQRFRLEKGSTFLDSIFGTHVHIFIPPWNRYNQTTQDILSNLGYNIISSELSDNQLVTDNRFQYYQEGCDHPAKLRNIIAKNAKREGLVVCMFHRYDFSDSYTMRDLQRLLREIKQNPSLHIVTMDELYNRDQSFNADRIKANLHHPLLTKVLGTRSIILPIALTIHLRVIDLLLHLFLVVLIAIVGAIVIRKISWTYWILQLIVLIAAGLQTWYQFVMPKIGLPLIIVVAMIVVCCFYFIICSIKNYNT